MMFTGYPVPDYDIALLRLEAPLTFGEELSALCIRLRELGRRECRNHAMGLYRWKTDLSQTQGDAGTGQLEI